MHGLHICFSKVNLSSSITPKSLSEIKTSSSSPHKFSGGWGVLNQRIVIECVLWRLSLIHHIEHPIRILTKSLFKKLAALKHSERDAT